MRVYVLTTVLPYFQFSIPLQTSEGRLVWASDLVGRMSDGYPAVDYHPAVVRYASALQFGRAT